jgi:hypothetical protein
LFEAKLIAFGTLLMFCTSATILEKETGPVLNFLRRIRIEVPIAGIYILSVCRKCKVNFSLAKIN